MRYIKQFSFIERVAIDGLENFYSANYSDDFVLERHRNGVQIEVVWIKEFNSSWEIISRENYFDGSLDNIDWHFNKPSFIDGLPNLTIEDSIYNFLRENYFFSDKTVFDWKAIRRNEDDELKYEVHIRHFEKNPIEYSAEAKFKNYYSLYFEEQFHYLINDLSREIEGLNEYFGESEHEVSLSIYDIFSKRHLLMGVLINNTKTYNAKYKDDIYECFVKKVDSVFESLRAKYPLLYSGLQEKYPYEFTSESKLQWHSNADSFFYLFNQLKETGILRNSKNRSVSFGELAKSLIKTIKISPERGESSEYMVNSFVERLKNPILDKNQKSFKEIKETVSKLVELINKVS